MTKTYTAFFTNFLKAVLGPNPIHLLFILLISFALRISGYSWGGGWLIHPDEQFITEPAYWMALKKTDDPGNYMRPAHWSIGFNNKIYSLYSETFFNKPLEDIYPSYRIFFTYLSRIFSAFWGTILVGVIFHVSEKIKQGLGWISAWFSAVFTSYICHSHYVTPDITLALFTSLSMLALVKYYDDQRYRYLFFLMICLAGCICEKYPGLIIAFFSGVFVLIFSKSSKTDCFNSNWFKLLFLGLGTIFIIYLTAPFLLLNFNKVLNAFRTESRTSHLGADGLGWAGNFIFYMKNTYKMGGLVFAIFIGIGIFATSKLPKHLVFILLVPFFFIILLSRVPLHWERWAVPYYIFPIICGSLGIQYLYQKAKKNWERVLVVLLSSIPFLSCSVQSAEKITYFISKENTFNSSREFCKMHSINKENSIYQSFTQFAPNGRFDFDFIKNSKDSLYMRNREYAIISSGVYQVFFDYRTLEDLDTKYYKELLNKRFLFASKPTVLFRNEEKLEIFNDYQQFIASIVFLKNVWIDKILYIPGYEIRIYSIRNGKIVDSPN